MNASMTYVWIVWKLRIMPAPTTNIPMSGTIQCTPSRALQPVHSKPMGSSIVPGTIDAVIVGMNHRNCVSSAWFDLR